MDNNFWLQLIIFLTIPRWFMSILYITGAFCIWYVTPMPLLIRMSLATPLFMTAIIYFIVDFIPFDFYIQSSLIRLGNFSFMVSLICNAVLYEYARKRNLL